MDVTRLSTKGQIILPKRVRDERNWGAGMEFTVEDAGNGILLRPASGIPITELSEVAGCLKRSGKAKPKTIEEMKASVGKMVRDRHDRGRY